MLNNKKRLAEGMRIVEINSCNWGSTGSIMLMIKDAAKKRDHDVTVAYVKRRANYKKYKNGDLLIGGRLPFYLHVKLAKITGLCGCFSVIPTLLFIQRLKQIDPDVIHLHNLHGNYINIPMLFNYIKKHNIHTVWTLHDCWSFTGHCPYFTMAKCDKWKTGCFDCPSYRSYPRSISDNSCFMYKKKKKWFTNAPSMTIVTPSEWLSRLVKQSYLSEYDVKVINNGIDLSVFKPTESNFRSEHALENKKVILGVAFDWGKRKGLDIFVRLAGDLGSDYRVVLVGTDELTEKLLPQNVITIRRTHDQSELAQIYTAADVFVNPTREDNYPTVNMEALACGTPVITFDTGGSPESIDEACGCVVSCDDYDVLRSTIIRVCETKMYSQQACRNRSLDFDMYKKYDEYVDLYEKMNKNEE